SRSAATTASGRNRRWRSRAPASEGLRLERGGIDVGFASRAEAEDGALSAPPAAVRELGGVALALRLPDGLDAHADAHLVVRHVEDVLEIEHPSLAVEQDRRAHER